MANYPTPHINAKPGDFGKTVLMPGDPLRSKFIADNYLENAVLVNNTRGVQGYTGTWKGVPVTVMASGMGIPSIGIYSWELYNFYDVDNIIRVGSAGALGLRVHAPGGHRSRQGADPSEAQAAQLHRDLSFPLPAPEALERRGQGRARRHRP
mgnify:CR=1 FL=1